MQRARCSVQQFSIGVQQTPNVFVSLNLKFKFWF